MQQWKICWHVSFSLLHGLKFSHMITKFCKTWTTHVQGDLKLYLCLRFSCLHFYITPHLSGKSQEAWISAFDDEAAKWARWLFSDRGSQPSVSLLQSHSCSPLLNSCIFWVLWGSPHMGCFQLFFTKLIKLFQQWGMRLLNLTILQLNGRN